MKFCKTYQNHMKVQPNKRPKIEYGRLKKTLKQCRTQVHESQPETKPECPECDETFFISLMEEMSAVVECFNKQAKKLLDPPLLKGIWKYFCISCNVKELKKGEKLLLYAMFNAIAFRKILKKYDKVHGCEKGVAFKTGLQAKHKEILHSPWFCELMAFHMNVRDRDAKSVLLAFSDGDKPSMTCEVLGSQQVDVDLTCCVCLDIVFDAVALKCGHRLCYMCACSAASVTIVDGLKAASPHKKCPLCRQKGVYGGAIHLKEVNILLSGRYAEYWGKRMESERAERLRLIKEHWEWQCRAFVGV